MKDGMGKVSKRNGIGTWAALALTALALAGCGGVENDYNYGGVTFTGKAKPVTNVAEGDMHQLPLLHNLLRTPDTMDEVDVESFVAGASQQPASELGTGVLDQLRNVGDPARNKDTTRHSSQLLRDGTWVKGKDLFKCERRCNASNKGLSIAVLAVVVDPRKFNGTAADNPPPTPPAARTRTRHCIRALFLSL